MKYLSQITKGSDYLTISFPQGRQVLYCRGQWYGSAMSGTGNLTRGYFPVEKITAEDIRPRRLSGVKMGGKEKFTFRIHNENNWNTIGVVSWNWETENWE
ncbi:MAG: hypothetical protein PHP92_05740 [Candidatus Nanoarchaeia archaeon]|nr:hypothetical protein [Candidatus Nanoarchaeia archaeon]